MTTRTVLVADDDPGIASVIRRFFERRGATVALASDGERAVALMRESSFDLAVFDVTMPKLGGYDLLPVVREHYPGTRVVLMSGYAEEPSAPQPDAFLEKPFTARSLEALVARLAG